MAERDRLSVEPEMSCEHRQESFGRLLLREFFGRETWRKDQPYEMKHVHMDPKIRDTLTDAGARMLDDFYEDVSGQYGYFLDKEDNDLVELPS